MSFVRAARERAAGWLGNQRQELGGRLTQAQAAVLAKASYVRRCSRVMGCKAADLFWAWAAQHAEEVTRRERGHSDLEVPQAGALAMANVRRRGQTMAWDLTLQKRVLRALTTASVKMGEMSEGEETVQLTAQVERQAWQGVKNPGFKGKGGYGRFRDHVVALMLLGECEGTVEMDPTEGDWWQESVTRVRGLGGAPQGASGSFRRRKEPSQSESGLRVGLDFGAGTQSARTLIEGAGLLYIPLDVKRWVYSAAEGEWVENVVLDLGNQTGGLEGLWERIRAAVSSQWSLSLGVQLVTVAMVWMSPPCRTFSNADASNRLKGWGYRDHRAWHRPPLQGACTKYGKIARQDDELVQWWMRVALLWSIASPGLAWFLENPAASLERRGYMVEFLELEEVLMQAVDYCAYGRPYRKSTRIWTNLRQWVPQGRTGNGQCLGKGRCQSMVGSNHLKTAAGGGNRVRGRGSVAGKSAVPRELMEELVEAVAWSVGMGLLMVE